MTTHNDLSKLAAEIEKASFERGWNSAMQSMRNLIDGSVFAAGTGPMLPSRGDRGSFKPRHGAGSVSSIIMSAIMQFPGIKTGQLIAAVKEQRPDTAIQTAYSALYRLNKDGRVFREGTKSWHVAGHHVVEQQGEPLQAAA